MITKSSKSITVAKEQTISNELVRTEQRKDSRAVGKAQNFVTECESLRGSKSMRDSEGQTLQEYKV